MFRKGTEVGYHETKDLFKGIRFETIICLRSNIEIISEVFPDFIHVNKQFEMPRLFSKSNSNDSKHFFLHYFKNPMTQLYGYVKHRISNPSRKMRETNTQCKMSKQNSILDLMDTYRILWNAIFNESRMYGLEGDLSYLSRSTLKYGVKKQK